MTNLPEGFKPVGEPVPVEVPAVEVIAYDRFVSGATVRYQGVVELSPEDPGDRTKVHTVRGPSTPDGKLFGIWRCQSLDRQLRHVRAGELVFLCYEGKKPHPTMEGSEVHSWLVAKETSSAPAKSAAPPAGLPAELK